MNSDSTAGRGSETSDAGYFGKRKAFIQLDPRCHKDKTMVRRLNWLVRRRLAVYDADPKRTDHLERRVNTGIPYEEYWQRRREDFWQQAYLRAYEITLTQPETDSRSLSRPRSGSWPRRGVLGGRKGIAQSRSDPTPRTTGQKILLLKMN